MQRQLAERIFIHNVIYQVVERHLLTKMLELFGPENLGNMTDAAIEAIVADDKETRDARLALRLKKDKIQEARETCARIAIRRDLRVVSTEYLPQS